MRCFDVFGPLGREGWADRRRVQPIALDGVHLSVVLRVLPVKILATGSAARAWLA